MKRIITILILLSAFTLFAQQNFEWEWQNPKPVGNTFNDAFAITLNVIVAVGQTSIFHMTSDGGATWETQLIDETRREIESVHFPTASVGYVAGDDGLLMKTTDGGMTWLNANSPTDEHLYGVEFIDADSGYVVGTAGTLLKTVDGGATWTSLTSPITNTIYAIQILAPDNIYIGTSSGSATQIVSQSTDYGATWNDLTGAVGSSVYDIEFVDDNVGYLGCSSNKVFGTTDAGATWTELADFGSSGNYRIKFVDALTGYVVDSGGDMNKTTDGGATWTETNLSTETLRGIVFAQSPLAELVDAIYVFGNYGVALKSVDQGATFNPIYEFVYHELQRQIDFLDANTGYVSGGATSSSQNLGYIIKTTDGGQTWADIGFNFGYQVYSFSMPSANVWYAGTGNNKMFKSTDGGTTWNEQTVPWTSSTHDFYETMFADENNGYAGGSSGRLMNTTDGGTTWTQLTTNNTSTIYDLWVFDANTAFIVGSSGNAQKTTDGGATWTNVFVGIPGSLFSIEFYDADPNIGYIAGYDSPTPTLARTTDMGDTWTPLVLPASFEQFGSAWGLGIVDPNTLWVSEVGGGIFYTNDTGATWTVMDQVGSNGLYDISIVGSDMWLCGSGGTILKGFSDPVIPVELTSFSAAVSGNDVMLSWNTATETNNSGFQVERKLNDTWERIGFVEGKGTTTNPASYNFTDSPNSSGSVYYRLKQIDFDGSFEYSNVVEVNIAQPNVFALDQNYPNPFNPTTTIKYSIAEQTQVSLKIYDILGNEITTLVNEVKQAGIYNIEYDASSLSSGVYFYELAAGQFISAKKMVILK
jgi:photosystem II stability/assembly factor-like uncharacterized protein